MCKGDKNLADENFAHSQKTKQNEIFKIQFPQTFPAISIVMNHTYSTCTELDALLFWAYIDVLLYIAFIQPGQLSCLGN